MSTMSLRDEEEKRDSYAAVSTMSVSARGDGSEYGHSLGSVLLQNPHTKERVLVPQPSNDPRDPLNWSRPFRYYLAFIVCLAMVMCNFLAAGPTVAIVDIAIDFFGSEGENDSNVVKVAYFFTTTSLMQGLGNLFWMPLIVKYGRRPVYLASFTLYTITAIWVGAAQTYANTLIARIVMGFAAGSGECLAPITISDIFFLHERGTVMAMYTASLNFGVSIGIICSGLITIALDYRYIYWIASALIGALTLIVFFTMPETSYPRSRLALPRAPPLPEPTKKSLDLPRPTTSTSTRPPTYLSTLHLTNPAPLTSEPILTLAIRPIPLLLLPQVLWATLVMSVTIGFLVAITSSFADAFVDIYNFTTWQTGLCFIAGFVGSGFGIIFGGPLSDWIADLLTSRNRGVREPEFRLPALMIGCVTTPLALALYGVSLKYAWHWIVPTLSMGLLNFSIAQATNVSLVYIVDSYRPIAGETVVTQLAFKSAFGFLLSFYTNPWIKTSGYDVAFGTMAGIAAAVLICWIPFYVWGKKVRERSLEWTVVRKWLRWDDDRECGE